MLAMQRVAFQSIFHGAPSIYAQGYMPLEWELFRKTPHLVHPESPATKTAPDTQ